MKIVLSSNPYRDRGLRAALEARQILEQLGAQTALCLPFRPQKSDQLDLPRGVAVAELEQELAGADMLICFGGDGTILHAARDAMKENIPILGINMGSVGFMAELERGELQKLKDVVAGNYRIEQRMMLDVKVLRGGKLLYEESALNDAVVSKGSMARVAEVEVLADHVQAAAVTGDGVIVSTPTGSTAYSMSAGGPIVEPTSQSIIVTPVCAHQLTVRAMVLAPERTVTVRLPKGSRKQLYLSVDGGKAIRLGPGERVEISRSPRTTKLVVLQNHNFYQLLHQKLGGSHREKRTSG